MAARYADEYNTIFATPQECRARREAVLAACERAGRKRPMTFSLMTGCLNRPAHRGALRKRAGELPRSARC